MKPTAELNYTLGMIVVTSLGCDSIVNQIVPQDYFSVLQTLDSCKRLFT